jgi:hypothetical protein
MLTGGCTQACISDARICRAALTHAARAHGHCHLRYEREVLGVINQMLPGGMERVSGIVHDHEAVCDKMVRIIQEQYPHIIDIKCQAHGACCPSI